MKYIISYKNPNTHYIDIQLEVSVEARDEIQFQLPAWRPGRYELGNFAKNIQQWAAFDTHGNQLTHKKLTKDLWLVNTKGVTGVIVKYNYFANEMNAGSSFLSDDQLYVNPVNCLLYDTDKIQDECVLEIKVPEEYQIAIALEEVGAGVFQAKNFDELVDSPFIASEEIQHHVFKSGKTIFHLWFQGEFKADWALLENDFKRYTNEQIKLFGDFPTAEYHYLFQIMPYSAYHGVEHSASTVILLGPSYNVLKKEGRYEDLLGVSSHELFHTWNVKRIRPVEMIPYDLTKENYTRLGYLTEGATTWYGDLMLYRSKVFDDAAFFRTFNQILDRHYNNPGSLNLSVAESSFDSWLDGYSLGVPNRKSSIYTEGALLTFILDIFIRRNTNNVKSFDDVLRIFYNDFYKQGKGISEEDYQNTVESVAQMQLHEFFSKHINGAEDFTDELKESMNYIGLSHEKKPSDLFHESALGIRMVEDKILTIYPNSIAERAGLRINDTIVSVSGYKLNNDLSQWLEYFKEDDNVALGIFNAQGEYEDVIFHFEEEFYYSKNVMSWHENLTEEQKQARKVWRGF